MYVNPYVLVKQTDALGPPDTWENQGISYTIGTRNISGFTVDVSLPQ
jgi:hypothetical protein